ncbi:hypothetical protein AMES_1229 [Amycolatopsis mediterranei S699]|uniref:Uncharacterized protein n=2 Tax=Amycolatopsis mediterranei TaxID=33910 RepID=A0A0H3D0L1_AMYMU|nr:hypothetical protein [Amycolatopsis mediterranei]ADJ43051.1 hypothetical protein AMED_1236 [Amycolatopsis mediterranei U32]AEK39746.1 hypothetical protein RAM_06270 [Amycolatopsis mediterranei S699]AFO74765.1 hypothetical protein AMES_1229 [Amycolatopsis mediterranei S699]AGT81894.1 hypothetical protein B737_1230 [Amycolatopsis mediterranei RB]KDO04959.1 hypothetical protein DV26_40155 [Amycolatopsis mediterranei]
MSAGPVTTRDYEAHPRSEELQLTKTEIEEISEMLLYEELSRARIRDLEEGVRAQRARSGARAARRWTRVARWAARRAERYQDQS